MRHHNTNRKLSRETGQRHALLKSLARSLVIRGSMQTTEARAKETRKVVEKLVTKAKNPTLANHRMIVSALGDESASKKLIKRAEAYKERAGGYTRIVKIGPRKGDASPMALIEFV
jgi:large subunit ribosomal protein L17